MQPLCYIALTALCSLLFLSPVASIQCNKTQYQWPVKAPTLCCNKCPPGNVGWRFHFHLDAFNTYDAGCNRSFFRVYYRSANVKAFTKHLWNWMCCMPGVPIRRTWRCGYVLQYLQNLLTAWVIWQFFIFWVVHEKPELCDSQLQTSNRDSFDIGS